MPNINIDDAYILNETGAQVDKVTGLFTKDEETTSGEKAFAQLNIGTAGSNRNLLDNPWFTVNQRGLTSGAAFVYAADRWTTTFGSGNANWTRESDGCITIGPTNTASHADLQQKIEPALASALVGKTITASAMLQDGTIYSGSAVFPSSGAVTLIDTTIGTKRLQAQAYADGRIYFNTYYGDLTYKAFKLELGSVSTLANDTPPNYAEELAKCQRYFLRIMSYGTHSPIAFGYGSNATTCRMLIPTPVTMRALPTVTMTGSYLLFGYGSNFAVTSLGAIFTRANGVAILASAASGIIGSQVYCLVGNQTDEYIDLSADL